MMLITGDIFIGNLKISYDDDVKRLFDSSTYLLSNFENVLQSSSLAMREDKVSNLQFSPEAFWNFFSSMSIEPILTLANNHIHDLGIKGIENTLEFLQTSRIRHFGVGLAERVIVPYVFTYADKKIALFACSSNDPEVMSIKADSKNVGVLDIYDPRLLQAINSAKLTSDYVIVLPHWGIEFINYPAIIQRKLAYGWIDAGADLVVGHHPHIIQGKEVYNSKSIYYSLGNFIFPNMFNKRGVLNKWRKENSRSIVIKLNFDQNGNPLISEHGLFFNTNTNSLSFSNESIKQFIEKTEFLRIEKYDFRKYYNIFNDDIYRYQRQRRSILNKVTAFYPKHKSMSRFKYFLYRLSRKLLN